MLLDTGAIVANFLPQYSKWKPAGLSITKTAVDLSKSIPRKDRSWARCHCQISHNLDGFWGLLFFLAVCRNWFIVPFFSGWKFNFFFLFWTKLDKKIEIAVRAKINFRHNRNRKQIWTKQRHINMIIAESELYKLIYYKFGHLLLCTSQVDRIYWLAFFVKQMERLLELQPAAFGCTALLCVT